jgi:hypothetical protein
MPVRISISDRSGLLSLVSGDILGVIPLTINSEMAGMETKNITIRVSAELAKIFELASEKQRRKLEALLSLKLGDATRGKKPLDELMSNISRNAQARGLTPEILDSILNEA